MNRGWLWLGCVALCSGCPSPTPTPVTKPPIEQPEPEPEPEPPGGPSPRAVIGVASFGAHHCFVRKSGAVECWGKNTYGQLGNGAREDGAEPAAVSGMNDARAVVVGADFSCALRGTGSVACWGNNQDGQLGDGKGAQVGVFSATPVEVVGLNDVKEIAAGEYHACALAGSGQVWCWGNGADGQIGTSGERAYASPLQVAGLSGARGVSVGASHGCALMDGGEVRCWGRNTEGQLGAGVSGSRASWVRVAELSGARGLGSGYFHSCAITANGGLSCWGDNKGRQLGPVAEDEKRMKTPVSVPGLNGVRQVVGGLLHTCVLTEGGQVQCWGDNASGQLQSGGAAASVAPITVGAAKGARALSLGSDSSAAVLADGSALWWGGVQQQIRP